MSSPDPRTRTVRNLVEPIAGTAFFAVEVHDRYEQLGFPNPDGTQAGIRVFDWPAYFAARAAALGQVSGSVAAAVFGVFPRARVAEAVDSAWRMASASQLLEARLIGTTAALRRMVDFDAAELGEVSVALDAGLRAAEPQATPLFSALRALPAPDDPVGRFWRLCDQFREHRMDAHVAAFVAMGLNGCEACVLNDARQGLPHGGYVRTRGWTDEVVEGSIAALTDRGLIDDAGLTEPGRRFREELEARTDAPQAPVVEEMAQCPGGLDRFEQVVGPWRQAVIDAFGYPGRRFVDRTASRFAR